MVECENLALPASSGREDIHSHVWTDGSPKAILQIAHGMAEHSARYDEFARFVAGHGYAVFAEDHAGHGPSAETKGYFAEKDGWECILKDMKALMDAASARYPGLPLFLLGHSMGCFLAQSYIIRFMGLKGAILSGDTAPNHALRLGRALAAMQKRLKGPTSVGKFISAMAFGGYNRKIDHPVNQFAWLSTVDQVCEEYKADPFCGYSFTAGGYYDMFTGMIEITARDWPSKVPAGLPVLIIAGDQDPVGAYGKGPKGLFDGLRQTGHGDVSMKLYPGDRHEVLNEKNKYEVYDDVLAWLEGHI